ncbi:MAG: hypothetical protein AVDCRST_MAG87-3213 [uncultured Thermomicrobiales bacterium]|uniref:Uncharacterized protein n=1 Tax=uncultured Thermomicrobiales bacterium TaxID=1645740 RepID=A0A6J4VHW7_9BACT|nr:MAG: hypothetical protein AVDCRST_MAG87-3213 [uncultured Thermomicrobiales bacterium]
MLFPHLPTEDSVTHRRHVVYGRHDPVERLRAHGHHDPDGFFGDDALRPDPVWMALRKLGMPRSVTALGTRIGATFSGQAQHRDVACLSERRT